MVTQFNVRLEKSTVKLVKSDRARTAVTNDIIAEVALQNWFTKYTPEQRVNFYKAHDRRPYAKAA